MELEEVNLLEEEVLVQFILEEVVLRHFEDFFQEHLKLILLSVILKVVEVVVVIRFVWVEVNHLVQQLH